VLSVELFESFVMYGKKSRREVCLCSMARRALSVFRDGNHRGYSCEPTVIERAGVDRPFWVRVEPEYDRCLPLHSIQQTTCNFRSSWFEALKLEHTSLSNIGLNIPSPIFNSAHDIPAFCPRPIRTILRPRVMSTRSPPASGSRPT
jgi:hypothetical protein